MVRVGEFSPLNPNLNSGRPLLGLGEYEERRKALLEQRKREYFQSMEQARLLAKSTGKNAVAKDADSFMVSPRQVTQKTVSTQTDIQQELPQNSFCITAGVQTEITATPHGGNTNSDEEIRQILYREELRKQIEEKQKLEAMKKEKEKLEEAILEARVQKQQEEMVKQYEEELARQRAIQQKKREQEEALHQHLVEMQQEAIEYREKLWKHRQQELKLKISNQIKENSVKSSELKNSHTKELLSEKGDRVQNEYSLNLSCGNITSDSYQENKNFRHITINPVLDSPTLLSESVPSRLTSESVGAKNALLPDTVETEQIHMINQNIRDAIPLIPQNAASEIVSPPTPTVIHRRRTNSETLDDKWQVPAVEKYVCSPLENNGKDKGRVLTQLGAFRKQLQQERLLLQQKLYQSKNGS